MQPAGLVSFDLKAESGPPQREECSTGNREVDCCCRPRIGGVSFGQFRAPSFLMEENWMKKIQAGSVKWAPIIKGCAMAVVEGNPDAEGQPFVIRFRCADGAKVPPHWHPTDENLTVLKGAFLIGMGDTLDESKLQTMNVGNFLLLPKEMHHFALNKGGDNCAGARDRSVQGELGESIRSATTGCASGSREAKIVRHASNSSSSRSQPDRN